MSTVDKRIKKLESDYVSFLTNESELQYLRRKYKNAHEWLGRLALETPDVEPGDTLRELRARIKEHETAKDRFKKARLLEEIQKLKRVKAQLEVFRPFRPFMQDVPKHKLIIIQDDKQILRRIGEARVVQGTAVCTDSWGMLFATGFREYPWALPNHDDTEATIKFWPREANVPEPAVDSYAGDWTGRDGFQFRASIDDKTHWYSVDPSDRIASAAVLQYTFPVAPCDSLIGWLAYPLYVIPWVEINAEFGVFWLDTVFHSSPEGLDFPASIVEYEWLAHAIDVDQTRHETLETFDWIGGGIEVAAGVQARLYIGCSVWLGAREGTVEIGSPRTIHFGWTEGGWPKFPGVLYRMVPIDWVT